MSELCHERQILIRYLVKKKKKVMIAPQGKMVCV